MNHLELAWAAGFFDGEGCISTASGNKDRRQLRISVSQMDRRPLDRFHSAIGGFGAVYEPKPHHVAKACAWSTSANQAVLVLQQLWPYLSAPKKEQTLRVMELVRASGGEHRLMKVDKICRDAL